MKNRKELSFAEMEKATWGKNEWWEQYQEVLSKRTDDEWSARLKK